MSAVAPQQIHLVIRHPFRVLGIAAPASFEEIKAAYRKLAMALHPDRNRRPDAAEQFRAVQAAYERLTGNPPYIPDVDEVDPSRIPYNQRVMARQGWVCSSRERP